MSEWKTLTLGYLSTQRKGINYKSEDYGDEYSGHPFITIKCFVKGGGYESTGIKFYNGYSTNADHLSPGDVLFSVTDLTRAGDIVGSPLRVPDFGSTRPALASMDCMRIEPIGNRCDKRFLYHRLMLSDVRRKMVALAAGSTVLHLDTKKVSSISIPIPVDVNLQSKIADILDAIDNVIEKTEALITKYQQIKSGLMHDLFTRGVLPNGQLRPPREQAPEMYHETPLGWIPKKWAVRKLGSMARIVSGVTLGSKQSISSGLEVPYLRVANVQDGYLDLTEIKTVSVTHKELEQLRLQVGDVLMNEGGDFDKLGRGAVWSGEIEDCIHQNHVFRVRTNSSSLLPYFLAFYSESSFGKKYFLMSSKQSTNLASINSTQLNAYLIALPSLEEQREIIERISAANRRLNQLTAETSKLRSKKLGLMHDLLTGKVPVKVTKPEAADG
ncbi:restriction endonuclease subunit S [Herbaspirillum seropedicae]|uniref:restriction endonuclease subunit S n=1 Tax=Herbaspirillum seropedicae TaxID=964 RepID=UPI003FCCECC5